MSSDSRAAAGAPRSMPRRRDASAPPAPSERIAAPTPPTPTALVRLRGSVTAPQIAVVAVVVGLQAAALWAMHNAIVDDSYISLDYARTLAFHGQWGPLPGIPANTATSPLNVVLLAAVTVVVRSPMTAMWVVSIANAAALAVGLLRLGERWMVGARLAWIAGPLLVLNPVLASSTGLETTMTVCLLVWLLDSGIRGAWRRFGWLSGAGLVLRPDLVVVIGVVWLLHPALRRPKWLTATVGVAWRAALSGLPWYLFSWFYFGSAIPDTLVMKQAQAWGHFVLGLWMRYYHPFPLAVLSVTIVAAVGVVTLLALPALAWTRYRPVALSVAACGLSGLVYFGVYSQLDVPPYFWYYGIPLAALAIVAAFGVAAVSAGPLRVRPAHWDMTRTRAAVLALALLAPMLAAWATGLERQAPLRDAPIHGNWALPYQYRKIGEDLARRLPPGAVVRSAGEFGTILYYCHCTLIDRFDQRGLIMRELLAARDRSWPMQLNYLWLDPDGDPLMRQDYHLAYHRHWVGAARAWNVWSAERLRGHYMLRPGPKPLDLLEGLAP